MSLQSVFWRENYLANAYYFLEMAKQTLNLYNVMQLLLKEHEEGHPSDRDHLAAFSTSVIASQTAKMRLPADYAIQDLSKIVEIILLN